VAAPAGRGGGCLGAAVASAGRRRLDQIRFRRGRGGARRRGGPPSRSAATAADRGGGRFRVHAESVGQHSPR
jgi:hypothetical protein